MHDIVFPEICAFLRWTAPFRLETTLLLCEGLPAASNPSGGSRGPGVRDTLSRLGVAHRDREEQAGICALPLTRTQGKARTSLFERTRNVQKPVRRRSESG